MSPVFLRWFYCELFQRNSRMSNTLHIQLLFLYLRDVMSVGNTMRKINGKLESDVYIDIDIDVQFITITLTLYLYYYKQHNIINYTLLAM